MTFTSFLHTVAATLAVNSNWRYGQTCFNVLYEYAPDLANSIRGTELDPFHDDRRVPEFLTKVVEHLD